MRYIITTTLIVVIFCITLSSCKQTLTSKNHELLSSLGLQRIKGPNSHHRKRLAVESRHHSRSDDSHMFIVKLPPHPHYYVHNKPNAIDDIHSKSRNLPVGFKNNGKPAKIYHWNLPLIKKIASTHKAKSEDYPMDFRQPESWNEVLDKPIKEKKPHKPFYYVPAKPKKSGITKYFSGNGKPHSFYVIEKSKKAHYHRLLP